MKILNRTRSLNQWNAKHNPDPEIASLLEKRDELLELPGVNRKTANAVIEGMTHAEKGWQAWKATNPRVEWFPDLPNPYEIDSEDNSSNPL